MMRKLARPYAVAGWLAALIGALGAITLRIVDPVPVIPDALGFGDVALVGFELLGVTFASVGALLVVRRPGNAVGWLMVIGLGFIFPTGRGHTPGWDRLNRIGLGAFLFYLVVLVLFRPGPLQVVPSIDYPFGIGPDIRSVVGPQISTLVAASGLLFVPFLVWSIVSRYRLSHRVGRQQLKWFVLALLVSQGGIAVAAIGALIADEPPKAVLVAFGFAGALVPVSIGIAILRYRLYAVDRLISRTIAYGALTAMLGAVFAGMILALQGLLAPFMKEQTIAVAASTLAVFALFQPLRRRVQGAVDRRFDRAQYDADQTVRTFAARLRGDLDLGTGSAEIVGTATSAVRPTMASIWLRGRGR